MNLKKANKEKVEMGLCPSRQDLFLKKKNQLPAPAKKIYCGHTAVLNIGAK